MQVRAKSLLKLTLLLLLLGGAAHAYLDPTGLGRLLVGWFSGPYEGKDGPVVASDGDADAHEQALSGAFRVDLQRVAEGIAQPTDIQFPPGIDGLAIVLQKNGIARWVRLDNGVHGQLLKLTVLEASEQGLLGLAFHPGFADNGRFFLNYVRELDGKHVSSVQEFRVGKPGHAPTAADLRAGSVTAGPVLMDVQQPYQNHNAGQLAFGPDGYLYVGWGDGGLRDDPQDNGQNPYTLLGSMLRIDVDGAGAGAEGRAYGIPADNPFVGRDGFRPEVWAYGLRNPWRYSFDPNGRLIVADVGQNTWEEISIVAAGDNLGWDVREGFACFGEDPERCKREGLVDPVFVYGRETGTSITGGYVYTGNAIPGLRGKYVFGDFSSGRLMAIALPLDRKQRVKAAINLGKWPLLISSFGRDHRGELYLAAFARGEIYHLVPAEVGP